MRAINPDVGHSLVEFVTLNNLAELLDNGFDAVIDACDALRIKVEMIAFCKRRKIPIVVSGSAGGRADPTLITARDLTRTEHDILLGLVRRRLRDDFGWTRNPKRYFGVQAVFSRENVNYPQADGSVCERAAGTEAGLKLDCGGGLGAAMHVTATFGMVAVARRHRAFAVGLSFIDPNNRSQLRFVAAAISAASVLRNFAIARAYIRQSRRFVAMPLMPYSG